MSKLLRNGIPRKENGKIDWTPRLHHGFTLFIVLCGFLFPPLAVAVRFGLGKDFFINLILTLSTYILGHLHNWFIQNVRNNDGRARTPKWALRYGLVDDTPAKKLAKKRQWTSRYNDRLPSRTLYDDDGNPHVIDHDGREEEVGSIRGGEQGRQSRLVEPDVFFDDQDQQQVSEAESSQRRKRNEASLNKRISRTPDISSPKSKVKSIFSGKRVSNQPEEEVEEPWRYNGGKQPQGIPPSQPIGRRRETSSPSFEDSGQPRARERSNSPPRRQPSNNVDVMDLDHQF